MATNTPTQNLPTASPEPTAGPSPTPGPWLTMEWQQVEVRSGAGPVSLAGLGFASVAGGPRGGLTLALSEDDGAGASALVRLGEQWTLVPIVGWATPDPMIDAWPDTLAARRSEYMAFVGVAEVGSGARNVRAWTSPDGITWRVAGELARMQSVREVAAGEDRIVACGAPTSDPSLAACEMSSDDGAIWRPSALPSGIREISGVIAFGDGFVAAASDSAGRLRTLLSQDGLAWTMPDPDPVLSAGGWSSTLVQRGGVAILAAGVSSDRHAGAGGAALFTSRDGRTWQRVALPATEAAGFGLVDLGSTVLAVGSLSTGWDIRDVALLTSSDGSNWRLEPDPPWADAVDTSYGSASGMAVVRAAIGSDCATQEIRLYAGTAVTTVDPGAAPAPLPTPAPDPTGAPAPPALTSVGSVPGWVWSATFGREGFLAVGEAGSSGAGWASNDGRTWTGGAGIPLGDREWVDVVAAWSGGYVAGGVGCRGPCEDGSAEARFWSRNSAAGWQPAPGRSDHALGSRDLEGPDLGVRAIVETAAGLIAVAVTGTGGAVFRSTDGITWRRVAVLEFAPFAAVAWRGGVIAAGGNTYSANFWGTGAAWYSPDGITWPEATMLESAPVNALAAYGDRVVAVARGPAALMSTDGRTWAWAPDQSTLTWGSMVAVLGGRDGFLALGSDRCATGSACLTAWRSTDGLAWSRSPIGWTGPGDVAGSVAGYLLVGGRGEALALVPWTNPYPGGDTETAIFGLPWAP